MAFRLPQHLPRLDSEANLAEAAVAPIAPPQPLAPLPLPNQATTPLRAAADFDNTFEPQPPPPASSPIATNVDGFALKPIPLGTKLQCRIVRRSDSSVDKLYPRYELFAEPDAVPDAPPAPGTGVFLLSARKRKKSGASVYLVSTAREEGVDVVAKVNPPLPYKKER
ncbi:hypothetical protein HKX48_003622 [Thoreauomyces humboldtii]|nr:hypothetical protein HKX48_003622 [Thoreauomyces humboldtii]